MNENNLFKRNFVIDEIMTRSDTGFRIENESRIKYLLEKNEEIPEQVLDVAVACAEIFRDNGNRDNRNKARVRHCLS